MGKLSVFAFDEDDTEGTQITASVTSKVFVGL